MVYSANIRLQLPGRHELSSARITGTLSKNNAKFVTLLDELAEGDRLTVVAGAGVSMDGGLPSWRQLVAGLLMSAPGLGGGARLAQEQAELYVEAVLGHFDLPAAATIARILHGDREWPNIVRRALYGDDSLVRPGPLAKAVADLAASYSAPSIYTTNYDDLLERALPAALRKGVTHLHGWMPQRGQIREPIILDERTYSLYALKSADILYRSLTESNALFVGMSLLDADVVQAVYHNAQLDQKRPKRLARKRVALIVDDPSLASMDSVVQKATESLLDRRVEDLALEAYKLNSFDQVAQFVVETRLRREAGTAYWDNACDDGLIARFGERLGTWQRLLDERTRELTTDRQRWVHEALTDSLSPLQSLLLPPKGRDDYLGLFLWVRRTHQDRPASVQLWGSSATLYADDRLYSGEREVVDGTGFIAVDCAARGRFQITETPGGSRWRIHVAVPVVLENPPWHRLLVGVVVLAATSADSRLKEYANRDDLHSQLAQIGRRLLDPGL